MHIKTFLLPVFLALFSANAHAAGGNEDAAREGWALIEAGALLIDVRTPSEYAQGHIVGAVNVPHTETARLARVVGPDKDRQVVLYCRSGRRSGIAQQALERQGYSNVFNATGYEALKLTRP